MSARVGLVVAGAAAFAALVGCTGVQTESPRSPSLDELRRQGAAMDDAEAVGQWLLAEEFAPGGRADEAADLGEGTLTDRGAQPVCDGVGMLERHDPPGAATACAATADAGSRLCHHEATPSGYCDGTYQ